MGTPAEVIDKINKEINAGLADPKLKERLADLGGITIAGSPGDFGKLIANETEKWGKVIRAANIKPERSGRPIFHSFRYAIWVRPMSAMGQKRT
jgi:hypothetical protein